MKGVEPCASGALIPSSDFRPVDDTGGGVDRFRRTPAQLRRGRRRRRRPKTCGLLNPYRAAGRHRPGQHRRADDRHAHRAPRREFTRKDKAATRRVAGLGIPFRVSGPWSRVSFRPALEEIVQNQLRDILSRQEEGNPLSRLGEALFGRTAAPANETPANHRPRRPMAKRPPAAEEPKQEERPRNPLEDVFRRAMEGQQPKQEPPPAVPRAIASSGAR